MRAHRVLGPRDEMRARVDLFVLAGVALVAGGVARVAPVEVAVLAVLAGVIAVRARAAWLVGVAALVVGVVRGACVVATYEAARTQAVTAFGAPARCYARGTVTGSPELVHDSLRWGAELVGAECEGRALAWRGRATLYGGPPDLARGDEVDVIATLGVPQRFWNEATGDPRPASARRGATASGGVLDVRIVRRGEGALAWIDRLRARVRARIVATFPEETAPMARALVLGESDLTLADEQAFRASGLAHLLAVSGMHLVIVVAGAVAAMRALLARVEGLATRVDVGRCAAGAGIALAWAYAEFAGASGSALRAAWMLTAALAARALGRRTDPARAFALSLLAMACVDPLVAFDASFLLSAAATAGLLTLAAPLAERFSSRAPRWLAPIARSSATTLAATIPCAPILARFAPTLPVGGVLANLIAVPVGELVALPLCLAHALLAGWPLAERGCAAAASGALLVVRGIARVFAGATALQAPAPIPTSWQLVALAAAFVALLATRGRARWTALALAAVALVVLEAFARRAALPRGALRATFLDVGQGDAALVDLPSGEAMLIDGGGLVGSPIDVGERVIAPSLRARRRDRLAAAVITHPHPDHLSGLARGLDRVALSALWDTGQGRRERVAGPYAEILERARASGTTVLDPAALCGARDVGGARVEVLAPCPAFSPDRGPNDNSFVLRITYGARAFLFVGDAEHEEEADLLRLGPARLHADVLKVGHHGSRTSSSSAFLAAVAPAHAVISCGTRNRFGHPHASTLDALLRAGVRAWRTDRDGAIVATTDGTNLEVRSVTDSAPW